MDSHPSLFTVTFITLNTPRSSSPLLTRRPFSSGLPCRPLYFLLLGDEWPEHWPDEGSQGLSVG